MALTERAYSRLAGQWGSYDFHLIRDSHFVTSAELIERFLHHVAPQWHRSSSPVDQELSLNVVDVRRILSDWAEAKVIGILSNEEQATIQGAILFKTLYFADDSLSFGSDGNNWRRKTQIAEELSRYKPWSIRHILTRYESMERLYDHMYSIIGKSRSPTELAFFDAWWAASSSVDRPMLFPQVWGHTSAKLWSMTNGRPFPTRFDFGFVNCDRRTKILIECDSMSYHSGSHDYQRDRDRQNLAEQHGWSVRRFTYRDVMEKADWCLDNLMPDINEYWT
jgi:hypothetical protein